VSRQPKILIVDTCYPEFLRSVGYTREAQIHERHDDLREAFMRFRFGTSDAYSHNLRSLGWDAQEIIANSLLLQSAWAHEHDVPLSKRLSAISHSALSRVPGLRSVSRLLPSLHRVLEVQVEATAPDVIYFQDLNFAPPQLLEHLGECWGADMYRVLLRSQITLNRHIAVAEGNANNMRLFEATGCGALLVTDKAKNLRDYFSDDEVLSYSGPADVPDLVKWAQHEPEQASEMAERAQRRTLMEHSYFRRMEDLSRSLLQHLRGVGL
jgi:hypothetical protein